MVAQYVLDDPDTLIRVESHPGFALDLTSWKIQITESGAVTKVIHWDTEFCRPTNAEEAAVQNRPEQEVRFIQLTDTQLAELKQTIDSLDMEGVRQLQDRYSGCFDDTEEVLITIPACNLEVILSLYSLDYESQREDSSWSKTEKSCLRSLIQLDEMIESFLPITAEKRYQERQDQREKELAEADYRRLHPTVPEIIERKLLLWMWRTVVFLVVFLLPAFGMYEIGKTLWYQAYYLKETGFIVGYTTTVTKSGEIYHVVVKAGNSRGITDRRCPTAEECADQTGQSVSVLVNPENREAIVFDSFRERWLPALSPFLVSGLLIFTYRVLQAQFN